MTAWRLPIYKGYTIDIRLQQIRKIETGEVHSFSSFRAVEILCQWGREKPEEYDATIQHYLDAGVGPWPIFKWLMKSLYSEKSNTKARAAQSPNSKQNDLIECRECGTQYDRVYFEEEYGTYYKEYSDTYDLHTLTDQEQRDQNKRHGRCEECGFPLSRLKDKSSTPR